MSLIDAFLVNDPVPGEIWIAIRPPEVRGTGSENDPYNGATLPNTAMPPAVSLASSGGTTITATTTVAHGYASGQVILIEGLSVDTLFKLLGPFVVVVTGSYTFTFITFENVPAGTYAGGTCRPDPYLFDAVMRSLPQVPCRVRLGPGVFETKGYADCLGGLGGAQALASWRPWSGLKLCGAGMAATTLKLVQAAYLNRTYSAVSAPTMHHPYTPILGFEASEFCIDANIAGQVNPNLTCGAIFIRGNHTRIRRIRVINFGRQGTPFNQTQECFVIGVVGSEYVTSLTDGERVNCLVEECVVERPGMRGVRETTCIHFFMDQTALSSGGVRTDGFAAYHQSCILRNNYIDCDYVENPVAVESLSVPSSGVSTLVTRTPHGLAAGDWFRVHGAYDASPGSAGYDNGYVGTFKVEALDPVNPATKFTYKPEDPVPTAAPMAGSDIWIGRFPSHPVGTRKGVTAVSLTQITTSPNEWELTAKTQSAHYLIPGSTVAVEGLSPAAPAPPATNDTANDIWTVVSSGTGLKRREFVARRTYPVGIAVQAITGDTKGVFGVVFQAVAVDGGHNAVLEGNNIRNCRTAGPYHDTFTSGSWVARNNRYSNVAIGVHQNMGGVSLYRGGTLQLLASSLTRVGKLATFTVSSIDSVPVPHGLSVGQAVQVLGAIVNGSDQNQFNGRFIVASVDLATNAFTYFMTGDPGGNADAMPQAELRSLWFTRDVNIDGNVIELLASVDDSLLKRTAINLFANPPSGFDTDAYRVFGVVTVRRNIIRYVPAPNGQPVQGNASLDEAVVLTYAHNGIVEENIVDLAHSAPFRHYRCSNVSYFNNRKASGQLLRGRLHLPGGVFVLQDDKLVSLVADATTLGFL